ncbi:MAG: hypothetical protein K8L99_13710 [Anaerolineae bacterium]|nr:hypothetical protein [Anaerolineae bacterium]
MGELIQQVFLSDFMIFVLMGLILLLLTGWMVSLREFAGYALGWLVGIFLIIMLSTLMAPDPLPVDAVAPTVTIDFLTLMVPSALGLAVGFGVLFLSQLGGYSNSRAIRALTIAALVSFTLVMWYLLLRSTLQTRVLVAIFVLTFAIGGLFQFILSRSGIYGTRRVVEREVYEEVEPVNSLDMGDPIQSYDAENRSIGDRVRSFRQRVRRYRE